MNNTFNNKSKHFPQNFLWGVSIASHQIEGDHYNDWTIWEKQNSYKLSKNAKKRYGKLNSWNLIKDEASNPKNYISGKGTKSRDLFDKDLDLLKELKVNSYRFSIEWSSIEPSEGHFEMKELLRYKKQIQLLKKQNIIPIVTIWHFTLPVWLSNKGGLSNKDFSKYLNRFTEFIVKELKNDVIYWVTLNESVGCVGLGYILKMWPPGKFNPLKALRSIKSCIKAHKEMYKTIKSIQPESIVGLTESIYDFEIVNKNIINIFLKWLGDKFINDSFLDRIKDKTDFIGVNHYFHYYVNYGYRNDISKINKLSDLGWALYPQSIYNILKRVYQRYGIPILITENGLADKEDKYREWYIKEVLQYVLQAINEGVNVFGYVHWSLLDNFEWDKGFWPKFGLAEVNYKTMERKLRKSAYFYSSIIKNNRIY